MNSLQLGKALLLTTLGLAALAPGLASAAAGSATVYQHCDYKGYRAHLPPGDYDLQDLRRLGVKNDDLSSLRIPANITVTAYQHHHFGGRSITLKSNDNCLVNNQFNDTISSIKVREGRANRPNTRPVRPGRANKRVRVYQHCDYKGYVAKLKPGRYTLSDLKRLGVRNDDLSSVRVPQGYRAVLFQHDNFKGKKVRRNRNDSCLVNDGFNDIVSSIIIREVGGGR